MEPILKYYTVLEIRNWLIHNQEVEGLSNQIIAPQRAWAIIHNPYVKDDDAVLCAIFEDNEIAAYTTAFPEMIEGKRMWWFSALWCNPKYRGQGYGLIVIGSLAEIYGVDNCLDKWGAEDTIEIFKYLGHQNIFTKRYILGSLLQRNTTKGKIVYFLRNIQQKIRQLSMKQAKCPEYAIKYITNIDDVTYEFIQNSQTGLFLRSQEMMNWVIQYPFTISAPLTKKDYIIFSPSEIEDTQLYAIQVHKEDKLVGFYIIKRNVNSLHLLYVYYNDKLKDVVFASIKDHILHFNVSQFTTEDELCANYIKRHVGFPKYKIVDISFSYPSNFTPPKDISLQYGDGDNFCVYY